MLNLKAAFISSISLTSFILTFQTKMCCSSNHLLVALSSVIAQL